MKIKPTPEQEDILKAIKEGKSLKIKAYAGSGKTSSIELITRDNPNLRFLYLAFNKAIANEAQQRMPNNCSVSTIHSLAYHGCMTAYKAKSDAIQEKLSKYWKARKYSDFLGIAENSPYPKTLSEHDVIWVIRETVNNFKISGSEELTNDHIPPTKAGDQYDQGLKELFLEHAKKVWNSECDLKDITTPMDHNTYLKMWELTKPKLTYAYVIIDESQDSNGAMLSIVQHSGCKTIFCGDQFQAIYGFNGAVNAMSSIQTEATLPLTKSWRFGRKIADQANLILDILEPGHLPLVGNDSIPSVVQAVDTTQPFTILCRTNGYLAELALTLIKTGKKVYVEGGVTQICNDLVALHRIKTGGARPQKSRYAVFKYFGEVIKESLIDKSIKRDIGLVSKLAGSVESEADLLQRSVLSERFKDRADVILSTAHKAKGLEFDQVIIGNDFDQKISKYDLEELHLMYVSVTRAKKVLQLPEWWYDLVEQLRSES